MTAAPLTEDALVPALLPFGLGTMLPAEAYVSPDVLTWEKRHFFAGTWTCLGRRDALFTDGVTQRAVSVGDVPVLLVRPQDRPDVQAFANTCRHRGHELLTEGTASTKRAVVCPYHAWSYDLAGCLITAPGFREVATFRPEAHGLAPLPVEEWHGWVFVNASGTAGTFAEHVGGLTGLVAPYAPESLVLGASHSYVVQANWKVITENYHECYHCPLIHPELCSVSPPASGENFDLPGEWVGGTMDLRDEADTMSLDGRSRGRPIQGSGGIDPRVVLYLGLFPNLLISLHPDYVMTHRMVPMAPDRTEVECAWYFPAPDDTVGHGPIDPSYAVEFWDTTNRQDWGACESVQRGLGSPHFRPGPLAPNEDAVHAFVTMVARGYQESE